MSARRLPPALLALTPGDLTETSVAVFTGRLMRAVQAGLRGVLVREPSLPDRAFLELAKGVRELLPVDEGWLGLHDRVHLSRAADAHGVHLGFRSLSPLEVRRLVDDGTTIGLSTHVGDQAACWEACDYRFFGPVFDTPSKRGIVAATGIERLVEAALEPTPLWALGGLTPERVRALRHGALSGVAVQSALWQNPNPARATRELLAAWGGER